MKTEQINGPPQLREGVHPQSIEECRAESTLQRICGKCRYLLAHQGVRKAPVRTVGRLLRWRLQCALGIPGIVDLPLWNARLHLPPHFHGAGTAMIYALRCQYETELMHLNRFVRPGMVVVDGGASHGIYTAAAANLVGPSGLVLSFEPGRAAFAVLKKNIECNRLPNVRAFHGALSDQVGKALLYHHGSRPNSFSLGCQGTNGIPFEEVSTFTLAWVAEQQAVRQIGFLKLDVEGAEELALRGGLELIERFRPTIALELNSLGSRRLGLDPHGSWELLESLRYRFYAMADGGDLVRLKVPPALGRILNVTAIYNG